MSSIDHAAYQTWSNYHLTRCATVADAYAFRPDAVPHPDGPARFAGTGRTLETHLRSLAGPAPAGPLGSAWSLSDLVGDARRTLAMQALGGVTWVETPHLHRLSRWKPREAVFVGGGATWAEVVGFVERDAFTPRSILTCGSYLQQTVAGSVGTATAGSRLGEGGVQNQVLGVHLVGGRGSTWLERASDPVIGHVALEFADEVIREDDAFADALVHLGGMGLVNGLVLGTVPRHRFTVSRVTARIDAGWVADVERGDFSGVARSLGLAIDPVYYEVQLDPWDPMGTPALHTMYFPDDGSSVGFLPARALRVADAVAALAAPVATDLVAPPGRCPGVACDDPAVAAADLFRWYSCCSFEDVAATAPASWGEIHRDPPAANRQGGIFSAAFAVRRDGLGRSLGALAAAAAGRPRTFLYTLRFVSGAAGTMAFQYPESVVIDFEGLRLTPSLERECAISVSQAHAALTAEAIGYRPHWGKLATPDAAKVESDYGPSDDPSSPLARWRATRARLLSARDAELMRNEALVRWEMV